MALYLTSSTLIDSVKRRISVPISQATFKESDFLALANEEMILGLVPSVMNLHEDYFLFQEDVPLVENQNDYAIPYRAIGNKLRDVMYVDTAGTVYEMSRVSVGDQPDYQGTYFANRIYVYYVINNKIRLLPPIGTTVTGTLRFTYYIRPSELVSEDRVGIISDINTTTGEVTLESFPEHFSTSLRYDLYMVKSPHRPYKIDISASGVNSTTKVITFDPDDLPSDLAVGDHVAQATESIIPQVPSDLHVVLAHRIAERILESQGDTEGLQNAKVKTAEMEMKTGTLIDDRVEESPMKVVNRHSTLRYGLRNRRYRRRP